MKKSRLGTSIEYICIIISFVAAIKILFVGYDIDEQYAFALSYRLLKGDSLIFQMWEPHQSSAFLLTFLIFLYTRVFSFKGVVLFSRVVGLLIHSVLMGFLWKYLSKRLPGVFATLITSIVFFSLPKIMFLPEFSNLQMWFLLGSILPMLKYFSDEKRKPFLLIATGICLAFEALSYPSTILLFFVFLAVIIKNRKSGKQTVSEILAILLPSVVTGFAFIVFLFAKGSADSFFYNIRNILNDGSHSATFLERLVVNKSSLVTLVFWSTVYLIISFAIFFIVKLVKKNYKNPLLFISIFGSVVFIGQIFIWVFLDKYPNYPQAEYFIVPIFAFLLLFTKRIRFSNEFILWILGPIASFIGVCIFTNHPFLVSAQFLAYTIVGLFVVWRQSETVNELNVEKNKESSLRPIMILLVLWALTICFGRIYMIRTTGGIHYTCFDELSLLRKGPACGIIADETIAVRYRDNYDLICDNIPGQSKVFYMGKSSDIYLFNDYEVCAPSVICTPTYNESTMNYFMINPEKKPDYIICENEYIDEKESLFGDDYIYVTSNDYITLFANK